MSYFKTNTSARKPNQDERRRWLHRLIAGHVKPPRTPYLRNALETGDVVVESESAKRTEIITTTEVLDLEDTATDNPPTELSFQDIHSVPKPESRQRIEAEREFKDSVKRLEEVMNQLIDKEHPKMVLEAVNFNDTAHYHRGINELGTVFNGLIEKWAESDEDKNRVKSFAEKWYMTAFPYLKEAVNQAKDYLPNPFGMGVSAILYLLQIPHDHIIHDGEIKDTLSFLSNTISQVNIIPVEKLRHAVSAEQLEGFDLSGFKLSAAITDCIADCIRVVTAARGVARTAFMITSHLAKSRDKLQTALNNYQTFLPALTVAVATRILEHNLKTEAKIDLPSAEAAAFDSHIDELDARCHPGTRKGLLGQIREWAQSPQGKCVFWLSGMAGTGKSTISRTVAQSFSDDGHLGASFFFKRGEGERGNASRFFTTIALHLVGRVPALAPYVRSAINAEPQISEKSLKEQFEKLICQPLSQATHTSTQIQTLVIVVDALDECEREGDIKTILRLLLRTRDLQSVRVRIFLTSRPELPIRLEFNKLPTDVHQNMILQDIPQVTIEHDISVYLRDELARTKDEYNDRRSPDSLLPADWPGDENIQALAAMAAPLFIFAATVCRFVGKRGRNPSKQLAIVLEYQTAYHASKLDRTYLPILQQLVVECTNSEKKALARDFQKIIGSIIILADPLSTSSLAGLLDISKEDIDSILDCLHSVLSIPSDRDSSVRLLHLSFRDFLLDPEKEGEWFWVDEKKTHGTIATRCLELMRSGLDRNICNLEPDGKLRNEIDTEILRDYLPPDVRYACQYWVHHLEQSGRRIHDQDGVHVFLLQHFLHWLEALSLLGKLSEIIALVDTLQSLVATNQSTEMSSFLCDARRFILQNRGIIDKAPLQLYSSAIIFAPEMSIIRNTFKHQIPKWICKLPNVSLAWSCVLQTLEGHTGSVRAVTFSHEGQLLASASDDYTVRLWNPATGEPLETLEGHTESVWAVAFSHDGQLLASASGDRTIRIWNPTKGEPMQILEGHTSWVSAVAFSYDDQLLASASHDRTVRLWNPATGEPTQTLEGHLTWIDSVSFSYNNQLLASASGDRTVKLWNPTTGELIQTLRHPGWISAVSFSHSGQLLASASGDSKIRLWNPMTGEQMQTLEGHTDSVSAVTFSPDGKMLASASGDHTVRLWNPMTGEPIQMLEGHTNSVWDVAFSCDGQLLASASGDHTVRLWNPTTGERMQTMEGRTDPVWAVAFSHDGQLLASASGDCVVRLWNPATGEQVHTVEGHTDSVWAVAFSHDDQLLASASGDGTVRLWNPVSGEPRQTLEGHTDLVWAVAFSHDGQLLASASCDRTVRVWNPVTGEPMQTLEGHTNWVTAVAFSYDGRLLASTSDDRTVRLWNPTTGELMQTLKGHIDWVTAVAFSRDGRLLASASDDCTIRLWNPATGEPIWTLEGHTNWVTAVSFSHDGQLLVSASGDRTVRLWSLATGEQTYEIKLDIVVSKICFASDHHCLETDGGLLSLPSNLSSVLSTEPKSRGDVIFKDHWITRNGKNLLWLPNDYRGCLATNGNRFVIGQSSGLVNFMEVRFN